MKNCKKLLSVIVTLLLAASLLTSSAFAISGEAFIATPGEVNLRDSGGFDGNVIDAAPQGDYEFWLSLMDSGLDPNCREEFEKTLEFTAIHAFLLGLRTGERLSPFILR